MTDAARERGVLSRLKAAGIEPRRSLGQNFLHDPQLLAGIVDVAEIEPDEAVFEVGTGPGTLTRPLADRARAVLSVEIDERLADFARAELSELSNVEVWCGDVLKSKSEIEPEVVSRLRELGPFRWVANLPYHVATPLILSFLREQFPWRRAVLTLQAEVAERLVAGPGGAAYGGASILVGFWARGTILRRIGAGTFWPRPKVESAVLSLEPRDPPLPPELFDGVESWVRFLFQSRRKQLQWLLRRRLGAQGAAEALERGRWDPTLRPEDLGLADALMLARYFP